MPTISTALLLGLSASNSTLRSATTQWTRVGAGVAHTRHLHPVSIRHADCPLGPTLGVGCLLDLIVWRSARGWVADRWPARRRRRAVFADLPGVATGPPVRRPRRAVTTDRVPGVWRTGASPATTETRSNSSRTPMHGDLRGNRDRCGNGKRAQKQLIWSNWASCVGDL